jgi:hypothetical protein
MVIGAIMNAKLLISIYIIEPFCWTPEFVMDLWVHAFELWLGFS